MFSIGLAVVLAVAGVTFVVAQALGVDDDGLGSGPPTVDDGGVVGPSGEAVLRADQVEVTGVAVGVTIEGATLEQLDTPLVVTTSQQGNGAGATLTDVEVDGQITDVVWDAGRPFNLEGASLGIRPQSLNLFAAPAAITVGFPDGLVNELVAGSYGLETPVAIGRGGLARSQDAVAFEATVESTIVFRGGATMSLLPRELQFESGGRVLLQGTLQVRQPDGTTHEATGVELPEGAYSLTATPRPDGTGYNIRALLQGPVTVT